MSKSFNKVWNDYVMTNTGGTGDFTVFQAGGQSDISYKRWKAKLPANLQNTDTTLYDLRGAFNAGLEPTLEDDGKYHLGSRDPKTGRILKSREHKTFQKALDKDAELGYFPYEDDSGTLYTFKDDEAPEGLKKVIQNTVKMKKPVSKVPIFKAGGSMTKDKNIIPDGVLHKEKNDVGDKGIPVVDKEGNKHMELEKEELILNHDNTIKVNDMVAEYNKSKDKDILIEIGKLLSTEIIENTDDKSNTYKEVKS